MVKAKLSNGDIILGLSAMNLKKLQENCPILFDGEPLGFEGRVVILYGQTEDEIAAMIRRGLDLTS